MPEFEDSIEIAADADSVFDFCADVSRMPDYLPTVTAVTWTGDDTIRVSGHAGDRDFEGGGTLEVHNEALTMTWASTLQRRYRGELHVTPGDGDAARVSVTLSFSETSDTADAGDGDPDAAIHQGLRHTLQRIKQLVEQNPAAAWRNEARDAGHEDEDVRRGYNQPRHGFQAPLS